VLFITAIISFSSPLRLLTNLSSFAVRHQKLFIADHIVLFITWEHILFIIDLGACAAQL